MKFIDLGLNKLEEVILREAINLHGGAIFLSPKGISKAVPDNPVNIIQRLSTGDYMRCPGYLEIKGSELVLTHDTWYAPDYILGLPFPSVTKEYCQFLISEYQRSGSLANVIFCPGNYLRGLCGGRNASSTIEKFMEATVPAKALSENVQNFILEDHLISKSGFELYICLKYSIYKAADGEFCIDFSPSSRVELYESDPPRYSFIDVKINDVKVNVAPEPENLLESFNDVFLEPAMPLHVFLSGRLSDLYMKSYYGRSEQEAYFLLTDEFGFQDFSELVAKALLGGQWISTWLCYGQHYYPHQGIGSRVRSYESMKSRIVNEKKKRDEQRKLAEETGECQDTEDDIERSSI